MDYAKLGKTLKYARERAGFTQRDIAELIGVTPQNVSSWERGKSKIDIDTLDVLCKKYGIGLPETLTQASGEQEIKGEEPKSRLGTDDPDMREEITRQLTDLLVEWGLADGRGNISDRDFEFLKALTLFISDHLNSRR